MSTYYFIPTRNVFGAGCVQEAGELLASVGGKKPLIVTDAFLGSCGMADDIAKILKDAGLNPSIFAGAEPNPTDKNCVAGLEAYKAAKADSIVSLGGGSAHDCAKGIGFLASNGGEIYDYEGIDKSTNTMVPLISINTTAGTASEITRFCIITDTRRKVKMAIVDWRCTPLIAINDPELMRGMPPSLTAATGMDALTHAIEAYVSIAATPLTDSAALMAINMIVKYLPQAVANGDNMFARDKMAYAQYLAGAAFNNASLGYVHAMAHQLGGYYNLPHGVCNAILLPYVEEFNLIACRERFVDIAKAMGLCTEGLTVEAASDQVIGAIHDLGQQVGIPATLADLDVKPKDFDIMADNAMKDACAATNPRLYTKQDVIDIYQRAYDGIPMRVKF
ncbi:iron-containing alcohol dehydrogenase [Curtanaerobium respiraculi]|uniref:iron-containing alcohol dehydrogenase n=1 Tax=Curtanaerobium respiraculi TaxID=2949669 RepID=UPI0024B37BB9|nr:iron-containing alcohol dehydrogenase [Curtanaerobium respiraculi]